MILGIGSDLCDIPAGSRNRSSASASASRTALHRKATGAQRAAGRAGAVLRPRFAAKEACSKALGTGHARGRVLARHGGREPAEAAPTMRLTGGALAHLRAVTPPGFEAVVMSR
jgi:holo-[acyl-carrier protein] synthase